jgi:hypothetical protein
LPISRMASTAAHTSKRLRMRMAIIYDSTLSSH